MPKTEQELILQLSRDISALEADCRRQHDLLDLQRHDALHAVPEAVPALKQFDTSSAQAAVQRDAAAARAAAVCENDLAKARLHRQNDLTALQQKYINADRAEDDKKVAKLAQEDKRYQAALLAIEKTTLDKQFPAREAAYQAHKQAIVDINGAWKAALTANRDTQQTDLQGALEKERVAGEDAALQRDSDAKLADVSFQLSIDAARAALTASLSLVPAAQAVQSSFDRQGADLERDCHAREDKLFADFREARKKIQG